MTKESGVSYWAKLSDQRLSRRRALVGASSFGATAFTAGILGCGGGSSESPVAPSVVTQPKNTTNQATIGGTLSRTGADQVTLDGLQVGSGFLRAYTGYVYSRLLKFKLGDMQVASGDVEGDLAESWETVGDGSQINLKLRPSVPFDPRPPTNGRIFDSRDVKFSWEKFSTVSTGRADFVNSTNPNAPLVSITTPDATTASVKFAYPAASGLQVIASTQLEMQPFEFADTRVLDPRQDMRGTGPFRLKEYRRSTHFEFERNANWYEKGRPYLGSIFMYIVTEYATQISQFRAGSIDLGVVRQPDIIQTKKDLPQLNLYQDYPVTSYRNIGLGYAGNSPFKDIRVRRAISLLFDRDAAADVVFDLPKFRDAGFPAANDWLSHGMSSGRGRYWVDPRKDSKDEMGEQAKWFKFDPQQAKQLLAAAGYANGFKADYNNSMAGVGSTENGLTRGMLSDAGIQTEPQGFETNFWIENFTLAKGNYNGFNATPFTTYPDPGDNLFALFHDNGSRTPSPPGVIPSATLKLMEVQRHEFDAQKRLGMIRDIQRQLAEVMPSVPWYGTARTFSLAWPWVMNLGVFHAGGSNEGEMIPRVWIDAKQKPT